VLILDTDHLAALEGRSEARDRLAKRLEDSEDRIATTIISAEEELRGWLAQIRRLNDPHREVAAYERLLRRLEFFGAWTVLPWDTQAADVFVRLQRQRIRCGSMDLKIASITLAHGAVLLTRNMVDFAKIPGLRFENWLA
jgi:tRNA(fMet)-specific endonuclease VapC